MRKLRETIKYTLGVTALLAALLGVWSCTEETPTEPEPNFTVDGYGYYVTELENGAVRGEIDKKLLDQLFEYKEAKYSVVVRPPYQLLVDVGLTPDEDDSRYRTDWYVEVRRFVPKYQDNLPNEFKNIVVYAKPKTPVYTSYKVRDNRDWNSGYEAIVSIIVADEDNPFREGRKNYSYDHLDEVDKDLKKGSMQINEEVFFDENTTPDIHSGQNCAASVEGIDDYLPEDEGCFFTMYATKNNTLRESYIKKHINRNNKPETVEVTSKDGVTIEFEEERDFTMLVPYGYGANPENKIFDDLVDLF